MPTAAEQPPNGSHLHLFAVDDPRLWQARAQLPAEQFTIPDLSDHEWDEFHAAIADA